MLTLWSYCFAIVGYYCKSFILRVHFNLLLPAFILIHWIRSADIMDGCRNNHGISAIDTHPIMIS